MPYRTIIALHNMDDDNDAIAPALTLCRDLNAHLSVVVVGLTPQPPMSSGYGAGAFEIWGTEFTRLSEDLTEKVKGLEKWIAKHQPADAVSFDVGQEYSQPGTLARDISRRARYSDLCIFTGAYQSDSMVWEQALRGALYDTGRPVLIMNNKACPLTNLKRVMLAWDGGVQAAISVRHAIELLGNAEEVHIAMADPHSATERFGDEPGSELATYLARHSIPVSVVPLATEGRNDAETLIRHATDMDAELIVMGGYGHSRLQDWFLGSTTSNMLKSADRPLLLAH